MNKEEMRKAFEEWLFDEFGRGVFGTALNKGGEYHDIYTRFMLEAWQARQPEIDELKAELSDAQELWVYYQNFVKDKGFDSITGMAVEVGKLKAEIEQFKDNDQYTKNGGDEGES